MKNSIISLASVFFGLMFSFAAYAGDIDVHFGPDGQDPTHSISGNIEKEDDRLKLVPDDAEKSNKVFKTLAEKAQSNFAATVNAVLVSNTDQSEVLVEFVLIDYQGRTYFVAELEDGTNLVWGYLAP